MATAKTTSVSAPIEEPKETPSEETKPMVPAKATKTQFEDDEPVTVIWKAWGTSNIPRKKTTFFDSYTFEGGVGRRIPYAVAKKWQRQGHGIHVLPMDATESDFIRVTDHRPIEDAELEATLRALTPDKLAALLGTDGLNKLAAMQSR